MGSAVGHFNVSFAVKERSQSDCAEELQLLRRKESRSGFEPTSSADPEVKDFTVGVKH